jgi:formylglycine-generating enzyme required for sulfatase activity
MGKPRQIRSLSLATVLALLMGYAGVALVAQSQDGAPPRAKATPQEGKKRGISINQAFQDVFADAARKVESLDFEALRRAVRDLAARFPKQYTRGDEYLRRADAFEKRRPDILAALKNRQNPALDEVDSVLALQREALLANPLLDFDQLLVLRRKPMGGARLAMADAQPYGIGEFLGLPRQSSMQLPAIPDVFGWENDIAVLSSLRSDPSMRTLFRPDKRSLLSDIELHWDADRLMFSMPDERGFWQVWEMGSDGKRLRRITGEQPDVHSLDSVYLPNGKIDFISTAAIQGVPCNENINTAMTYQMDGDGKNIRQLTFDQDHNYNPTVMNDGRVLYLRWEYTDTPHVWARYLFTMNPDGTDQRAYYKSGAYWPNSIFSARAVPGHPTKVVGIVTGHHVGRVGELIVFDPAKARAGSEGVVQRIPGYGKKVEPIVKDQLTLDSYPKFLNPYPLSENYFLVSAKPTPESLWGIYLVDVFDNMTLIKEEEGQALMEPIPLRKTPKPPSIPERVDLTRKDGQIYISDIYSGPGLTGIPRGAVKSLRLFTYQFAYPKIAGIYHKVGADGPWEPKLVLGTVPVEKDGSVFFNVPAQTPISIQPLDEDGAALQLMRSWMTAQPGEFVSCNGCHESQSLAAVNRNTVAIKRPASEIAPWWGPERGFSFKREVQPVLDRYCLGCHNQDGPAKGIADLRGDQGKMIAYNGRLRNGNGPVPTVVNLPVTPEMHRQYGGIFDPSFIELRKYVRVGGLESDIGVLDPAEFHPNTTELVQVLAKGHHGVQLDREAWDRLFTWIDLNAPDHGTWTETIGKDRVESYNARRRELQKMYAVLKPDAEAIWEAPRQPVQAIVPKPAAPKSPTIQLAAFEGLRGAWPLDAAAALRLQASAGKYTRTLDLGGGIKLEMVLVPAGEFMMGDATGSDDEKPLSPVRITRPFWMGTFEVTNEQYARFDPSHDSRIQDKGSWGFSQSDLGWPLNQPRQPVIRVSQKEAAAFAGWLSKRTGEKVTLPTEAQWEYACRGGTATPFWYGDLNTDFSKSANLADYSIRDLVYDGYASDAAYPPDLVPRDARFKDGKLVTADVGSYKPNVWGLYDMHGNAWEWTRSAYRPYPYNDDDGRNAPGESDAIVVRGGSWYDRPVRSRSAFRLSYPAWQRVFNVGLRVVVEASDNDLRIASSGVAPK